MPTKKKYIESFSIVEYKGTELPFLSIKFTDGSKERRQLTKETVEIVSQPFVDDATLLKVWHNIRTKIGFYAILGKDGHVYDSCFSVRDHAHAYQTIQETANRIRKSGDEITGKARYIITRFGVPPKRVRWNYIEV